ncbi:hypothetical protein F4604DRAFT_1876620 [Suillus subluteus]|nr:hypothetical protein F4604DRAFT_1876620 [Suillus subluteus]
MASNQSTTPPPTLQRGKACLRCRCDGSKPACQQCVRAKQHDACQYDDGKGKTRTQLLREHIERLEQRIRELEDPEYTSPSVTLHDPHRHGRSESSSSSLTGSPASTGFSLSVSSFSPSANNSPQSSWIQGIPSPSPTPFTDIYHEEPQPTIELAQTLVDVFFSHCRQSLLGLHYGSTTGIHHPVLTNAIFLWACFISRPGPLSTHDDALQYQNRLLDVIQASCLLSVYFLSNGRALEGSYHANAAASLAIQCGLHGTIINRSSSFETTASISPFKLDPPKDAIEAGRAHIDVLAVTIPHGSDGYASIIMPWPQDMEEYVAGQIDDLHSFHTVRSFFDHQVTNVRGGFSPLALRVKASALFERAHHLASTWDQPLAMSNAFTDDFQTLEHTIARFIPTLIPVHQLDATLTPAMINLYYPFGADDPISYDKCLRAARCLVSIIKHIADADYEFLDPIIGPCWTCAMDTLIRELNVIESSWPLVSSSDVRSEIGTMLYAMNNLSSRFPLLGYSVAKVQKRLSGL